MPADHAYDFPVPPEAIDANGHANNVEYVRWMQDAAVRHFESAGGAPVQAAAGGAWVVRTHHVEYLKSAVAGDVVRVRTWVDAFTRVTSTRHYEFTRPADGATLARGRTEWVFVDATTGRPKAIPAEMRGLFGA